MRKSKIIIIPWLLFTILFTMCSFVIGSNLGARSANTTAAISYVKQNYPTSKPLPTYTLYPKQSFKMVELPDCNAKLLIPGYLNIEEINSNTTILFHDTQDVIFYTCDNQDKDFNITTTKKNDKETIVINAKKIDAYTGTFIPPLNSPQLLVKNKSDVGNVPYTLIFSNNLRPLIESSLVFKKLLE